MQLLSEGNLAGGVRAQEKARDERRPGYQARVKKKEGREESDLRKIGKRK